VIGALGLVDKFSLFTGRKVQGLDPATLIDDLDCTVLDTELTGLDLRKDSMVSVGAIAMAGTRIDFGRTFYMLMRPETAMSSGSVVVHGITPSEVKEEAETGDVLDKVCEFVGNSVIVGHFISLDIGFINKYLRKLRNRTLDNPVLDTCRLYEWLQSQQKGFGRHFGQDAQENKDLFTIARRLGIQVTGAHNALSDAFITAQVFQRLLRYMQKYGVHTLGDLLRVGRP